MTPSRRSPETTEHGRSPRLAASEVRRTPATCGAGPLRRSRARTSRGADFAVEGPSAAVAPVPDLSKPPTAARDAVGLGRQVPLQLRDTAAGGIVGGDKRWPGSSRTPTAGRARRWSGRRARRCRLRARWTASGTSARCGGGGGQGVGGWAQRRGGHPGSLRGDQGSARQAAGGVEGVFAGDSTRKTVDRYGVFVALELRRGNVRECTSRGERHGATPQRRAVGPGLAHVRLLGQQNTTWPRSSAGAVGR